MSAAEPAPTRRLVDTLRDAAEHGIDGETLERARRADYGLTLRSLNDPASVCSVLASSHFGGYGFYEGFDMLAGITADDVSGFVREYLKPERLVLSTVLPKERT